MNSTRRVTVRLDRKRTTRLVSLCQETGWDRSEVVRQALDQFRVMSVQLTMDPGSLAERPSGGCEMAEHTAAPTCHSATSTLFGLCKELADKSPGLPPPEIASKPYWPTKLVDLLGRYRAFGMPLWGERRSLYQRVFAASIIAAESGENVRDVNLCAALQRIGREYDLI